MPLFLFEPGNRLYAPVSNRRSPKKEQFTARAAIHLANARSNLTFMIECSFGESCEWAHRPEGQVCSVGLIRRGYCNFAYSALACFRMGMSGSASFQRVRKS